MKTKIISSFHVWFMVLLGMNTSVQAVTVTPFATGLYQSLYSITSDATKLYFTGSNGLFNDFSFHPDNGIVASISQTGGPVKLLYSSSNYATSSGHVSPFQITTDKRGNLYWADPHAGPSTGAAFITGKTNGSTVSQFFGICCGPGVLPGDGVAIALGGNKIYFGDATGGRIGINPNGTSSTQIGPTRYTPDFNTEELLQIAVANGKIFIADSAELRVSNSSLKAIKIDQSAFIKPGVRWISIDGSSGFIDLTSPGKINRPHGIVAVGNFVYVTSSRIIWRINQNTGATTIFANDARFQDLQGITFANGAFYVLDSRTVFGAPVNGIAEAVRDGPGVIWKVVP